MTPPSQSVSSAYGSLGNVSATSGAGPAPTTKPPTPPQAARYPSGTLTRNKGEYRTPPVVAPPQVPSNYAPNYPKGSTRSQYGTLPHSQVSGAPFFPAIFFLILKKMSIFMLMPHRLSDASSRRRRRRPFRRRCLRVPLRFHHHASPLKL